MKSILVINGPNLNMLGVREPAVYGDKTLDEVNAYILERTSDLDVEVEFFQTNHEGDLIDEIQAAYYAGVDGIVLNAGALTHYSYALRDAIASVDIPFVEVHISDVSAREAFRRKSVIGGVCAAHISGKGYDGYVEAVELLDRITEEEEA
jgi:3-dehydroquinate dehydratase-2